LTVAEIAAVVEVATALVLTVKLALSPPCATLIEAGTVPDALELDSAITIPPVGAWPVSHIVARVVLPPVTVAGERLTFEITARLTVIGTVTVTPA
jgi:hypothetical protein